MTDNGAYAIAVALIAVAFIAAIAVYAVTRPEDEPTPWSPSLPYCDPEDGC